MWVGAFSTFMKICGPLKGSLGLPPRLVLPLTSACSSRDKRSRGWGEVGGQDRARDVAQVSYPALGPSTSLSAMHLTSKLAPLASLQPCLAWSNPLPPSCAHRGGCQAAHCQVQRIKIPSGKTHGCRSNINLQDLASQPRGPFLGYLATDTQLETRSSPSDHHYNSQPFTHWLPAGSMHLRTPRAQVWPAWGFRSESPFTQPGAFPEAPWDSRSAQCPGEMETAPLTL